MRTFPADVCRLNQLSRQPIAGVLALMLLGQAAGESHAMGMRDAELRSQLAQPLQVRIPLLVTPQQLEEVQARLVPAAAYEGFGLQSPDRLLERLQLEIRSEGGEGWIELRTATAVHEPIITLLVELQDRGTRVIREFTLLLDLPGTAPAPAVAAAPRPAVVPVAATPGRETLQTPVAGTTSRAAAPTRTATAPAPIAGERYGPVRVNDTLSEIAMRVRTDPQIRLDALVWALQDANPRAFLDERPESLIAGAVLQIPDMSRLPRRGEARLATARPAAVPPARIASRPVPVAAAPTAPGWRLDTPTPGLALRLSARLASPPASPGLQLATQLSGAEPETAVPPAPVAPAEIVDAGSVPPAFDETVTVVESDPGAAGAEDSRVPADAAVAVVAARPAAPRREPAIPPAAAPPPTPWGLYTLLVVAGGLLLLAFARWRGRRRDAVAEIPEVVHAPTPAVAAPSDAEHSRPTPTPRKAALRLAVDNVPPPPPMPSAAAAPPVVSATGSASGLAQRLARLRSELRDETSLRNLQLAEAYLDLDNERGALKVIELLESRRDAARRGNG